MRAVVLLALAVGLLGCGPRGSWLPTRSFPDVGGPTALFEGTLLEQNGCVYVRGPLGHPEPVSYLVIWPFGYTRAGDAILDASGTPVVAIGGHAWLGGGEAVPRDYGIPGACATTQLWGAYSVRREPLPPPSFRADPTDR